MALNKIPVNINFTKGVNTKSDPYQVPVGNFLALQNSVFDTEGRLTKRNGFDILTTLPNTDQTTLSTFNGNLLATGSNLYAYNPTITSWTNQGTVQPIQLETVALTRSSLSQSAADAAVTADGLICTVYLENSLAYYQVSDSTSGQHIVTRTALPSTATNPRVFLLNRYFIVTFKSTVTATTHLQYIAIPIVNPSSPSVATDISTSVSSLATAGYDGYVANNTLYMAWAGGSTTIKLAYISSTLVLSAAVTISSKTCTLMSVTADTTSSPTPVIWISYWDSGSNNGYSAAFDQILNSILASTQIINGTVISELTSIVKSGVLSVFYQVTNTYSFNTTRSDYLQSLTVTQAGVVGSATTIVRSVGLASKAFITSSETVYMLAAFQSSNQPSYFLIDDSGSVYMRLAYQNGNGYKTTQVLPNVSLMDDTYMIPYPAKDFLASVNKNTNLPTGTPTNGIYTQTGINLAKFTINQTGQQSLEIADSLHLTGGQLWQYDGVKPVEHSFQVWPEDLTASASSVSGSMTQQTYYYVFTYEWTDNQGILHRSAPSIPLQFVLKTSGTFVGNRTSGSALITGISSTTNLQSGMPISGTGIAGGAYILSVDSSSQITMSANATSGSATSTTITPTSASTVLLNVPTLRLTYKVTPNTVRIVGYRWSAAQQIYYQFTSITAPTQNDTTTDSVQITDNSADSSILGNVLLYTTGGVIENIAAPASVSAALYNNRLVLIPAEDPNTAWYSKQIIENTPVEFSDLFTIYTAPTTGAQASTGPTKCVYAMDDKLLFFKENAIYYVTGKGPDNTGANNDFSDSVYVTSSVGCSNPNSLVLTPSGVMFQSNKGIWLLGRDLSTNYIGAPVEAYNDIEIKSATTIPGTNQVRFILDNGITLVYDYYYNQWGTFSNIRAASACIYEDLHTYLNASGQVYQESIGSFLDGGSPVLLSFTTSWINIAGLQGYERFYYGFLLGTYYSPFKLNLQIAYDYGTPSQSIIITPDNQTPNWGGDAVWGSNGNWGGPGNVFESRFFPQIQKCESFQLIVNEIYDASYGQAAGQGLTLSGLNLVIGAKKGYRAQKASRSFG